MAAFAPAYDEQQKQDDAERAVKQNLPGRRLLHEANGDADGRGHHAASDDESDASSIGR